MTILWERCDICGRAHITRSCWLRSDVSVCPYCCIACPRRQHCPRPAWFAEVKLSEVSAPRERRAEQVKAVRALEELLRKLEETS